MNEITEEDITAKKIEDKCSRQEAFRRLLDFHITMDFPESYVKKVRSHHVTREQETALLQEFISSQIIKIDSN